MSLALGFVIAVGSYTLGFATGMWISYLMDAKRRYNTKSNHVQPLRQD